RSARTAPRASPRRPCRCRTPSRAGARARASATAARCRRRGPDPGRSIKFGNLSWVHHRSVPSKGRPEPCSRTVCRSEVLLPAAAHASGEIRRSPLHQAAGNTMSTNQLDKKSEAWSALFSEPMSELVKRYTASVFFDKRLWLADNTGSLAYAEMLAAHGIIGAEDRESIERGMAQIRSEIEDGSFEWKLDLEDVHLNIEARLTQLVGDAGKRLHTGRSRNDQVATDVRLWLRDEIDLIVPLLNELQAALVDVAEKNVDVILPGFTHLQVAQPVSFAHHLLAYVEMFSRDAERMADVRRRTNRLPLGSAALAGTTYPLDRERVARTLGMVDEKGEPQVCQNSLDGVSDRDFAIEFTAAASLCMVHISRFSEELILWMSQNFGFVKIADRFTTGSSIMPQKKNPDVPELARGKTGRVVGHLMGLITLMKGQPL